MMIQPVRLSRSLGLAWALARQGFEQLTDRLGLGIVAIRAVLPRAACRALDRDLKQLETLVRRILFLAAMDTPLPPARRAGRRNTEPPPPQPSGQAGEARRPLFPLPAFRLTESVRTAGPEPDRLASRLRARSQEDPPGPDDLLPAAPLFNRLAALQDALVDPGAQVARFRRKLARIRADKSLKLPVADLPPPDCLRPDVPAIRREIIWRLHDAALSWLPILDSG